MPSEPYTRSELESAIGAVSPEADVRSIDRIEMGENAVSAVEFDDAASVHGSSTNAILKVGTATPGRVAVEGAILRFVASRTDVPVPEPIAAMGAEDPENPLDHPFVLMERIEGETVAFEPETLPPSVYERVCVEAGRHLASIHDAATFEGYGPLEPSDDGLVSPRGSEWTGKDTLANAISSRDPPPAHPEWGPLFEAVVEGQIERLQGTRSEHLLADLRSGADRLSAALLERERPNGEAFESRLLHMDYRLGNLVLIPEERPVTAGVIDWGGAAAGPVEYELAHVVALLLEWPTFDDGRRRTLEERFFDGYADGGGRALTRTDLPEAYDVSARLRLLRHVETAMVGRDPVVVDAWVDRHERAIRCALDRG